MRHFWLILLGCTPWPFKNKIYQEHIVFPARSSLREFLLQRGHFLPFQWGSRNLSLANFVHLSVRSKQPRSCSGKTQSSNPLGTAVYMILPLMQKVLWANTASCRTGKQPRAICVLQQFFGTREVRAQGTGAVGSTGQQSSEPETLLEVSGGSPQGKHIRIHECMRVVTAFQRTDAFRRYTLGHSLLSWHL